MDNEFAGQCPRHGLMGYDGQVLGRGRWSVHPLRQVSVSTRICIFQQLYAYIYVCMYVYDLRHDMQIPCTRYVAINRIYLYNPSSSGQSLYHSLTVRGGLWLDSGPCRLIVLDCFGGKSPRGHA